MLELVAGIVVAVAAVAAVLQPLLAPPRPADRRTGGPADEFEEIEESASPKVQALLALKEIEFDRATGKLSDDDYGALRTKYSRLALDAIQQEEEGGDAAAAEEMIRRAAVGAGAVCPRCGPRPEAEAAFCSSCGAALVPKEPKAVPAVKFCESCGAKLQGSAKFCAECGTRVVQGISADQ